MVSDYNKTIDYSKIKLDSYQIRHRMRDPFDQEVFLDHEHKKMVSEIIKMDSDLEEYLIPHEERSRLIHSSIENAIGWKMDDTKTVSKEDVLNTIDLSKQSSPPWSTNTIRNIHRRLVGESDADDYRRTTEAISAPNDRSFTPCPHENIRNELARLMEWMDSSAMDPITTSILMINGFESIRPFDDGNSITATMLFHMYLGACGIENSMLCDIGSELCRELPQYIDLAMYAERTGSYTQLVNHSIERIHDAYSSSIHRMESIDLLRNVDENTRIISTKAREKGRFTLTEASTWVELGEQSVRMKLDSLVAAGILRKEGKTRGMRYVYNGSDDDSESELLNR